MQTTTSYAITALLLTVSTGSIGCQGADGDETSGVGDNAFQASDWASDDAGPAADEQRPPEPRGACSADDVCGCDGGEYVAPNGSCVAQMQPTPTPVQQLPPMVQPPPAAPLPSEAELICTAVSAAKVASAGGGFMVEMVLDVIDDAPLVGGILAGTARTTLGALGLFDAPMCQVAITLRDFTGLSSVRDAVTTLKLPLASFNLVGINPDALTITAVANCCEAF